MIFSLSLIVVPLTISLPEVEAGAVNPNYKVVEILSPTNTTYSSNLLTLEITFPCGGLTYTLTYSIDGISQGSIPLSIFKSADSGVHVIYTAVGSLDLPALAKGSHYVSVTIVCGLYNFLGANPPGAPFKPVSPGSTSYEASWTDTVYFTIDPDADSIPVDSTPPIITYVSLENAIYNRSDIPLNFTVDEATSRVAYSLDGKDNVTVAGNTTLTNVTVGAHNLTVYAWDTAENVAASKTVNFEVDDLTAASLSSSESFLLVLVVAAPLAVAIVFILGMLFYIKRRKSTKVK